MNTQVQPAQVDRDELRDRIRAKYTDVAQEPDQGFHFHTGRPLASMLGYSAADVDALPAGTVESFAGTGNPFSLGALRIGEAVLDLGCGAGFDSLIAARQVGPSGSVTSIDMTQAMLEKTQAGAAELGYTNVDARLGYLETLPVEDALIDVVISNGVINLTPDKMQAMREVWRVLKPGGRFQIADIIVHKEVPQDAKDDIELWSG